MKKIFIEIPEDVELEDYNIFLAPKDTIGAACDNCDGEVHTIGVCGDCDNEFNLDKHLIRIKR